MRLHRALAFALPLLFAAPARAQPSATEALASELCGVEEAFRALEENNRQLVAALEAVAEAEGAARASAELRARTLRERRVQLFERLRGCERAANAPATREDVLEENVRLSPHIVIERGRRVGTEGQVDRAAIQNALRTASARFDRCYQVASRRQSSLGGAVEITFTVDITGRTTRSEVAGGALPEPFTRCLERAARRLRAPGAARGSAVTFAYRLRFGGG